MVATRNTFAGVNLILMHLFSRLSDFFRIRFYIIPSHFGDLPERGDDNGVVEIGTE